MNWRSVLGRLVTTPPHKTAGIAWRLAQRQATSAWQRQQDGRRSTYTVDRQGEWRSLQQFVQVPPLDLLRRSVRTIPALAERACEHRFNLLGSGWTRVAYGSECRGCAGHTYRPRVSPAQHLNVNAANRASSEAIWNCVSDGYEPIDWQLDFKSGYRWSEETWSRDIRYGNVPGADVKVPWELARMQHLPQLAWAYALAAHRETSDSPERFAAEFRNQVLDFIAHNPPRYGVNWACAMDVGIRAANWLLAYDLFRACGHEFDEPFRRTFGASIFDHGSHLANHLEWNPSVRGNHYLADLAGLIFVAAYLPPTPTTDEWLQFAAAEFVDELDLQFGDDGANFEASTCYHRLSAEIAAFTCALLQAVPRERLRNSDAQKRPTKFRPGPPPSPLALDAATILPTAVVGKLDRMADFTYQVTRPDGQDWRVVQWGDNDSGRFVKWLPDFADETTLEEDSLRQLHVVGALAGLFVANSDLWSHVLDYHVVRGIAGDCVLPQSLANKSLSIGRSPITRFDNFGAYIFRYGSWFVAARCGPVGQRGRGGHAHNDALSFELCVGNDPLVVDPGTYLYTPAPDERNEFRSTHAHSTLAIEGEEQIAWNPGTGGLFALAGDVHARVLEITELSITMEHDGYGAPHRRRLEINASGLCGWDECDRAGKKLVAFPFAPQVQIESVHPADGIVAKLSQRGWRVRLSSPQAKAGEAVWSAPEAKYSAGYGLVCPATKGVLAFQGTAIEWRIEIMEDAV